MASCGKIVVICRIWAMARTAACAVMARAIWVFLSIAFQAAYLSFNLGVHPG